MILCFQIYFLINPITFYLFIKSYFYRPNRSNFLSFSFPSYSQKFDFFQLFVHLYFLVYYQVFWKSYFILLASPGFLKAAQDCYDWYLITINLVFGLGIPKFFQIFFDFDKFQLDSFAPTYGILTISYKDLYSTCPFIFMFDFTKH